MFIEIICHSQLNYEFNFIGVIVSELQKIATAINNVSEPVVLATLVEVIGSSYRQPGARMVFDHLNTYAGVISAGCLETDIISHANLVLTNSKPMLATYDMGSDLDLIWGTGMGCQGNVKVLLEKIQPELPIWIKIRSNMLEQRQFGAMALIFAIEGESTNLKVGDWFIYNETVDEIISNVDFDSLQEALKAILVETKRAGIANNVSLIFGDIKISVLTEPLLPPFALWIFGAGEHSRPIAKLAKNLGWFVGIIDHRPALATEERFPEADKIIIGQLEDFVDDLSLDNRSAVLVISHVYEKDKQAIELLSSRSLTYLGLQGNRKRSQRLFKELAEAGFIISDEQNNNIYFPAGLDIGAETPEAIALSMLAEIQAVFMNHKGGFLRSGSGSIH